MAYSITRTGDLIEISFSGPQTNQAIVALHEDIIRLSEGKPRDVLVDISGTMVGHTQVPTNLLEFFNGLPFRRYAIFGGNPAAALRTKQLLTSLPENPSLKFFRDEENARAWLES